MSTPNDADDLIALIVNDIRLEHMPLDERIVPLFKFDPCPRCGALHLMPLFEFKQPLVTGEIQWPYFTACPTTGEPIISRDKERERTSEINANKLTGRELDTAVAEQVMGWKRVVSRSAIKRLSHYGDGDWWHAPNGEGFAENVPPYSTDHAAAFAVEEEIKRRGWCNEYIVALMELFGIDEQKPVYDGVWTPTYDELWMFIHATAEQKCRAALNTVSCA